MTRSVSGARARAGLLLAPVFLLLAMANAGGYRYGTGDQAFYIPAVLRHLDPSLFPRDRAVIDPQSEMLLLDEAAAWVVATTGVPLEALFVAGFVISGLVLGFAAWRLAGALGADSWGAAAFVVALTLKHRVARTGVNTFEGYFHPRVLAFAIGLLAVGSTLAGRPTAAALLVLAALVVHPTTALWFAAWVAVAWVIVLAGGDRDAEAVPCPAGTPGAHAKQPDPTRPRAAARLPRVAGAAAALAVFAGIALVLAERGGVFSHAFQRMDPEWLALLASKDYLLPTEWRLEVWGVHVLVLTLVAVGYAWRRAAGATVRREGAMLLGYVAVVALFAASLPFIAARIALAVQLQTNRVLWPADALATFYLAWMLVEGSRRRRPGVAGGGRRAAMLALVIAAVSVARGSYVTWIERDDGALARVTLPPTPWVETLAWLRTHTPADAHVLADPGHAWKHDVSIRVGAARDVFLEEVKDTAMSIYSRRVASRVLDRIAAGPFDAIGPRLDRLVTSYGLTHLVIELPDEGPVVPAAYRRVWQNQQFAVYDLRAGGAAVSATHQLRLDDDLH